MSRPTRASDDKSHLDEQTISILDQARQKLQKLTNALSSLQGSLLQTDLLPPWTSFEYQMKLVVESLRDLSEHTAAHGELLDHLAVHPLPAFPGRTQEALLGQLLRKKPEPAVEDWLGAALAQGRRAEALAPAAEQDALCGFAIERLGAAVGERAWAANYTLEEHEAGVETVVTGLRRKLDDDYASEESEGEEEGDEMAVDEEDAGEREVVDIHRKPSGVGVEYAVRKDTEGKMAGLQERPPMPLAEQLRFMTTGALPK